MPWKYPYFGLPLIYLKKGYTKKEHLHSRPLHSLYFFRVRSPILHIVQPLFIKNLTIVYHNHRTNAIKYKKIIKKEYEKNTFFITFTKIPISSKKSKPNPLVTRYLACCLKSLFTAVSFAPIPYAISKSLHLYQQSTYPSLVSVHPSLVIAHPSLVIAHLSLLIAHFSLVSARLSPLTVSLIA